MTEPQQSTSAAAAHENGNNPRADQLLDLLRRERADFLNYKHRAEQDRGAA